MASLFRSRLGPPCQGRRFRRRRTNQHSPTPPRRLPARCRGHELGRSRTAVQRQRRIAGGQPRRNRDAGRRHRTRRNHRYRPAPACDKRNRPPELRRSFRYRITDSTSARHSPESPAGIGGRRRQYKSERQRQFHHIQKRPPQQLFQQKRQRHIPRPTGIYHKENRGNHRPRCPRGRRRCRRHSQYSHGKRHIAQRCHRLGRTVCRHQQSRATSQRIPHNPDRQGHIQCDGVLLATGRTPRTEQYGFRWHIYIDRRQALHKRNLPKRQRRRLGKRRRFLGTRHNESGDHEFRHVQL